MYVWVIHIFHTKNLKIRSKNAICANLQLEDNATLVFAYEKNIPLERKTLPSIIQAKENGRICFLMKMPPQVSFSFLCLTFDSIKPLVVNHTPQKIHINSNIRGNTSFNCCAPN